MEYNFFYRPASIHILLVLLTGVVFTYDFNVIMVPIVPETGNFRNDFPEHFRNVPEFRFSGTISIMEMEKISGSFPCVNRNPEFRWKP